MTSIIFEVVSITVYENGRLRSKLKKVETITFASVLPTAEDCDMKVGNLCGRYYGEDFKVDILDPELFGKFTVGQRVDLLKALI